MKTLLDIEKREATSLAPYAQKSSESKGRRHAETEHAFRSVFQRDRDRIIHCNAFRRLEYKTQVFVYHEGDHYRTRLTHTIEVAQIARTIARALGLNEDLSEAIALAHDLGHPPFGHTGEKVLDELMKKHGGFEHNAHSLRIVEELERRYPAYPGLNLSWEVREGIAKHRSEHDHPGSFKEYEMEKPPSLEAQIVDIADEIAYNNHDIDDGLSSEMLDEDSLMEVTLWRECRNEAVNAAPGADSKIIKYQTIVRIINTLVSDLVENTAKNIAANNIKTVAAVRGHKGNIATFSPEIAEKNRELKRFLRKNLYNHYRLLRMADKAKRMLTALFEAYIRETSLIAPRFLENIQSLGKERAVCDHIAGMTDRYALDEYKKLFDPYEKV
ncbi:MAG: deoxyguanosinetriphosphate triphosphohydrolase [Deltaproteobacteria bacterium]|nr:deoxyguanosinetriphosphate triphosphohydrolase [Deltaproteobacteria bacterium]